MNMKMNESEEMGDSESEFAWELQGTEQNKHFNTFNICCCCCCFLKLRIIMNKKINKSYVTS